MMKGLVAAAPPVPARHEFDVSMENWTFEVEHERELYELVALQ
jgi:hypothetical protein